MDLKEIMNHARIENRRILTEVEAKQIISESGIHCTSTELATSREEAIKLSESIGYPVVLKISSVDISHKSDAGGVKLNLQDKVQVKNAFDNIFAITKERFPNAAIQGVSVQKMVPQGIEIVMGMIKDPNFGPVLMFGLGGIFVEVFKDVAFRIVPLERRDASEMIKEIKGYRILKGFRTQNPVDTRYLENMLLKLSAYVEDKPEFKEIDINPIFAYTEGAVVVDARIVLENMSNHKRRIIK
jgi:acyl-CoA synthetase (NDP forming)